MEEIQGFFCFFLFLYPPLTRDSFYRESHSFIIFGLVSSIHCCMKVSPNFVHAAFSFALVVQSLPATFTISSSHRCLGLPLLLLPSGVQFRISEVHFLLLAIFPAKSHFSFLEWVATSVNFVCSRMVEFLILSIIVMFRIILSIFLCVTKLGLA